MRSVQEGWVEIGDMGILRRRAPVLAFMMSGLAVTAVLAWSTPGDRVWIVGFVPFILVVVIICARTRVWVDPQGGTVLRRVPCCWVASRQWGDGDGPALINSRGGTMSVRVGARTGRYVFVRVMTCDGDMLLSQPPEVLRFLAAEVERWAPGDAVAVDPVAPRLRAQAEHVEAGRPLVESPLQAFNSVAALRMARGGAAGVVLGWLFR